MLETLDASKVIPELYDVRAIVGLPDGGALVFTYNKVLRLDPKGGIKVLITVSGGDKRIDRLLQLPVSNDILLIQGGNLTRIRLTDGKVVKKYQIDGGWYLTITLPLDHDTLIASFWGVQFLHTGLVTSTKR